MKDEKLRMNKCDTCRWEGTISCLVCEWYCKPNDNYKPKKNSTEKIIIDKLKKELKDWRSEFAKEYGIKTNWECYRKNTLFDEKSAILEICKRIEKIEKKIKDKDGK